MTAHTLNALTFEPYQSLIGIQKNKRVLDEADMQYLC